MEAIIRTDMNCTNCGKTFIAQLDLSIDGNHVVECPYCGHDHCRVIKAGRVTDDRWESRNGPTIKVAGRSVWKADSRPAMTSTGGAFIRDSWLSRLDVGG